MIDINQPRTQGALRFSTLRFQLVKTALGTRLIDSPGYEVETSALWICSDPSFESDPSNEYSLLRLTHVMNSIFLDPSDEFLTQVVNIGIPKQILGFCFHFSKRGYKIGYELTREEGDFTGGCQCSDQLPRHGRGWQEV